MELSLDGKVALVTAASRGLGRAAAEALLAEGSRIVVLARTAEDLAALVAMQPDRCAAKALFAGPHATDRVRQLGATPKAMGTPQDFGAIVAMMCAEATCFVTGTGQIIDGGELKGV